MQKKILELKIRPCACPMFYPACPVENFRSQKSLPLAQNISIIPLILKIFRLKWFIRIFLPLASPLKPSSKKKKIQFGGVMLIFEPFRSPYKLFLFSFFFFFLRDISRFLPSRITSDGNGSLRSINRRPFKPFPS